MFGLAVDGSEPAFPCPPMMVGEELRLLVANHWHYGASIPKPKFSGKLRFRGGGEGRKHATVCCLLPVCACICMRISVSSVRLCPAPVDAFVLVSHLLTTNTVCTSLR